MLDYQPCLRDDVWNSDSSCHGPIASGVLPALEPHSAEHKQSSLLRQAEAVVVCF